MGWISQFSRTRPKPANYAEKALSAYRLGVKAGGAIQGVRILVGEDSCAECRLHADIVYSPEDAPILPLDGCTHAEGCRCAYTPAMKASGETVDWGSLRSGRT